MSEIQKGQITKVRYEGREFEVIVIDPHGLGPGQPTVGFGFRMMERYAGIPQPTLSQWLEKTALEGDSNTEQKSLKLPSSKTFRVIQIAGADGNAYEVLEASDWFELAFDLLEHPGKTRKSTKSKLLAFLRWFAIKGFYAEAYTSLKGVYTAKDSRATSRWLEARMAGIPKQNEYTDFLQAQGCVRDDFAYWTDYVYIGLFNMQAWQMKRYWKLMEGDPSIGRNYIPKVKGVEAVAFCEEMIVKIFAGNLQEAHDEAIKITLRKPFFEGDEDE